MNFYLGGLLSAQAYVLAFLAAFILGISKAGVKGIAVLIVTLMALAFGGKASTGMLMPLLIVGDIFAISYYHRHTQWHYLKKFLPWMMLGVVLGVFIGKDLPEKTFQLGMGVTILATLGMLVWWEQKKEKKVPTHWTFGGFMGVMAGITTMIGNLAGAFSNIYFLALKLPKNHFIGTAAWLFFFINLFKLPFHIFVWKTISIESLQIFLYLVPGLVMGLLCGIWLVKKITDLFFRRMILVLTALGAFVLFFK
ncbi:MAG: sulfite exporter TauE/SafE family protein [Flavobacteriia bacterium]|nr:sulfite exporter TauE/SafE family protein [Flavobacteriia bacterium]